MRTQENRGWLGYCRWERKGQKAAVLRRQEMGEKRKMLLFVPIKPTDTWEWESIDFNLSDTNFYPSMGAVQGGSGVSGLKNKNPK